MKKPGSLPEPEFQKLNVGQFPLGLIVLAGSLQGSPAGVAIRRTVLHRYGEGRHP
jgi:hypothetical protein